MTVPFAALLDSVFDAIAADPQHFEFFAAVRAVERAAGEQPRLGRALNPGLEPMALAHHAAADFPRTTVEGFERTSRLPRLRSNHLGLTGPMGPMPFYLTELVIFERDDRRGPRPLGDFLDLISTRPLQFFYRAWADSQPCAQADRPADDGFAAIVGAVAGAADLRFVSAAERPEASLDGFDPGFDAWARLGYAGHFAGLRSASAVADLLSSVLGTPVRVEEGVGRWRDVPPESRTRIGRSGGDCQLGLGATLGGSFYATEWDVTIVLTAPDMATVEDLLPGNPRHGFLAECASAILPQHIEWSARIEIDEARVAPARLQRGLGGARLGQTAWVAPQGVAGRTRSELRLRA